MFQRIPLPQSEMIGSKIQKGIDRKNKSGFRGCCAWVSGIQEMKTFPVLD
jgi:hypothetical protein